MDEVANRTIVWASHTNSPPTLSQRLRRERCWGKGSGVFQGTSGLNAKPNGELSRRHDECSVDL
jgi:hypothetical protein